MPKEFELSLSLVRVTKEWSCLSVLVVCMPKEFELSLSLVRVTKEFGVVQVCWCSTGVLHKRSSVQNWRNWHAVKEVVVPLRIRLRLPHVLMSPHSSTVSCHTSDPTIKTLMRRKGDCCLFCCRSLFSAAEAVYLSILPFSNATFLMQLF